MSKPLANKKRSHLDAFSKECAICCTVTTVCIDCPGCGLECCVACAKRYIVESIRVAHCMSCKVEWSMSFLLGAFPKSWVTGTGKQTYRTHQKKILLDREKARLPESMLEIPRFKEMDNLASQKRSALSEIQTLKAKISALTSSVWEVERRLRRMDHSPTTTTTYSVQYLCPCPLPDCRGLVEKRKFKCAVCEGKLCRSCRQPRAKGDQHICNPDDVKNVRMLREDTRPCPKCAVPIYKIEGCDQMHCVECRTTFSWKTGKLETGTIHNPHAVRWMREHGRLERDILDLPCGGVPDRSLVDFYFGQPGGHSTAQETTIIKTAIKFYDAIARSENNIARNVPLNCFGELRLQYLVGRLTEKQWQQKIFLKQRENDRRRSRAQIWTTFRTLGVERLRALCEDLKEITGEPQARRVPQHWGRRRSVSYVVSPLTPEKVALIEKFLVEMKEIKTFINQSFRDELLSLGSQTPPRI